MTTTYARNIRRVLDMANATEIIDGMHWYDNARELATEWANGNVWKGAGVIAAYSPMTPWWRNLELAQESLTTGRASTGSLKLNVRKAQAILDGAPVLPTLNGPKLQSFASAIADPNTDMVTVDQHAYSIAMGKHFTTKNAKFGIRVYREIAQAYRDVAADTTYTPIQVQAITWVVWRNLNWHGTARKGEQRIRE